MKRLFDIIGSVLGALVFSPWLLLIGLCVWWLDGRPILFSQTRVGWRGRDFKLLKFRTMTVQRGAEQGRFDLGRSSRVTALGRRLRQTKLDELPQLWNVLSGDMSLVGPRPEVRKWVEVYPEKWGRVLTVRPGITDPASIVYRNEEEVLAASPDPEDTYRNVILPRKLDLYEEYVRTRTWWGDIGILLNTLRVVIMPQNASNA